MSELKESFSLKILDDEIVEDKSVKIKDVIDDASTFFIDTEKLTHTVQAQIETFQLVSENDPILHKVLPEFDFDNSPINPADFASSMVETCMKYKGYGLSANQCGFEHRMFVMGAGTEYVAFFNPKLIKSEGECHVQEACLSFPGLGLYVTRPEKIWVEYQDYNGNKKEAHYIGLSARCWLHELDHMDGIVYTKKVKPLALQQGLKRRLKLKQLADKAQKQLNRLEKLSGKTSK